MGVVVHTSTVSQMIDSARDALGSYNGSRYDELSGELSNAITYAEGLPTVSEIEARNKAAQEKAAEEQRKIQQAQEDSKQEEESISQESSSTESILHDTGQQAGIQEQ